MNYCFLKLSVPSSACSGVVSTKYTTTLAFVKKKDVILMLMTKTNCTLVYAVILKQMAQMESKELILQDGLNRRNVNETH